MYDQNNLTGGLQYVPQIAVQQVIYLDFDGESTSYDGEILSIDGVEVAPSQLTAERIALITAKLNERYASQGISFVTERPLSSAYSTIFVGKTAAFDRYGSFAGLAETIDKGNVNKSDNAFVLLNAADTDETIIATISHETDHLTGTLDHGGEGLAAYAAYVNIGNGTSSAGMVVGGNTSVGVSAGGLLENASVNYDGIIYVYHSGTVNVATVNSGGSMYITSGGTALEIKENGGYVSVGFGASVTFAPNTLSHMVISSGASATLHSNTVAIDTTLSNGDMDIYGGSADTMNVSANGVLRVYSGGIANNVSVKEYGSAGIYNGGTVNIADVNSWGRFDVYSGGTAGGIVINKEGSAFIEELGFASDVTVNNGADLVVSSGGTALMVKENGGYVIVQKLEQCRL